MEPVDRAATTLVVVLGLLGLAAPAVAGPCLDVGLLSWGASEEEKEDVTSKLLATGSIESIGLQSNFQLGADVAYDALFVAYRSAADNGRDDFAIPWGDDLAEYLDAGGAVVITQLAITEGIGPTGRFRSEYLPLSTESNCGFTVESNTPIEFPGDASMFHSVSSMSLDRRTRVSCYGDTIRPGAVVHASLPNGQPLVVSDGPVVAVNVYYRSTDVEPVNYGYPADADFPQLFANAINTAAGFDPATACNGDYDDDGLLDDDEMAIGTDFQRADTDADDVVDGADNCPLVANPDQRDWDDDGTGDACDDDIPPDTDGDGHSDPYDNCPDVHNPDQADANDDGIGDACEPEPDTDAEPDTDEGTDVDDDTDEQTIGCSATPSPVMPGLALLPILALLARRRRPQPLGRQRNAGPAHVRE